MKRSIYVTVLFLFIYMNSFGQYHVSGAKSFKYRSDSLLLNIGINHPDFKKVDFELRFWIKDQSGTNANDLFILHHYNKSVWHLYHYQICLTGNKYVIANKSDSLMTAWSNNWKELVDNNILTLPDEDKARKRWRSSSGLITTIGDGVLYIIELSTKNAQRRYSYSNPEINLKIYDLNNEPLININKIISILENQFRFKESFHVCAF